ncbi:aminoglycoside phosphotransferase family protein [Paraurantiacibacter namhicola]|uniref:Phosphotransferase enzyme family protein n=1 Tax=Paraurantiacibacter namhicola TaxID=645517 RepID=A0A1C7D9M0_9SPHN|nr:phosphotransferase [Paraurantiacibacter namhicola]ANU08180.1 Phosphotransferase enzyme family protein [Paraurantiacibacter namhicola]
MSAPDSAELPDGMHAFLAGCGWDDAMVDPIPGDASFRRYFRLARADGDRAMLMHAPPPHEDPAPFLHVAKWLAEHGQRAPAIFAEDAAKGWVLTEDFGDDRMRDWLDEHPAGETGAYGAAVDALARLHREPAGPFPPYDMATYLRETDLFTEWYCPLAGLEVDGDGWRSAWEEALAPMMPRQAPGVTVLRDYHAENIMLLGPANDGTGAQGLIDFQDALAGHPAYDLVSLLQDARRDVSEELEARMLERYAAAAQPGADFRADYARLGAQRNAKIVGIFARLNTRDGKPRYLGMIPRVWAALERDLQHPALAPVLQWFDANIPQDVRDNHGGKLQ